MNIPLNGSCAVLSAQFVVLLLVHGLRVPYQGQRVAFCAGYVILTCVVASVLGVPWDNTALWLTLMFGIAALLWSEYMPGRAWTCALVCTTTALGLLASRSIELARRVCTSDYQFLMGHFAGFGMGLVAVAIACEVRRLHASCSSAPIE